MNNKKKWNIKTATKIFHQPFFDLMFKAQKTHRRNFKPNYMQVSVLLSIKTGLCPEDCKYCSQSAKYNTGLSNEKLINLDKVINAAKKAKKTGATRFCMGAAWKNPKDRDMPLLESMIKHVKDLGLETCMTLGMLNDHQVNRLANAGLDFYNHNLDTSPEYYKNIVTTRSYNDRLVTIEKIRNSGIKVCSGGILGLGETIKDRISLLVQLSNLSKHPESVPINMLVKIKGTPMENNTKVSSFDFIRIIALSRIMMPNSFIRLSAGREYMNDQMQALCFMAGANSVFYGCKLLTTSNPSMDRDIRLFKKLNLNTKNISDIVNEKMSNQMYYNAAL
ncbi:biotin synthase [Wigglesworthia glossinidia endosymbiont of Glossina morsitans morsitans (Yale colony)]|uniref:Biotin synthase n=1 Tax=Wigglesworthia glossinidia endosymbiont of Glossina morsitans morsitans (Yale colony) TaxID=1142511 RepID=H6Q5U8_WIGGL|nr:biotin synthase BioB [Wigglesworthia glossinidia]AFA41144.1 biotin synthase [Wigglesworthia glossinidia endosymbiont of Glossina morsitans morsitans (Yale colony)]